MKQILLITLFSFAFSSFMIASTDTFTDKMAVIGSPGLSSDPCAVIDKKLIRLDEFTTMINNTSAFHLEERASALPVPGITVSNNKKKMLRDAKKKYAEYSTERQKYGCDTPMSDSTDTKAVVSKPALSSDTSAAIDEKPVKQDKVTTKVNNTSTDTFTDKMAVIGSPGLSSDPCAAIDKKLIRLDEFTTMVNNTSAFHLEEKAEALSVPGITVSNNKKKMLRDAKKKSAEYSAERQKYACDTPMPASTDKKAVVSKSVKQDKVTTKVNNTSTVHVKEKAATLQVPEITQSNKKEPMLKVEEKQAEVIEVEHKKYVAETPTPVSTAKTVEKKAVVSKPALSSDPSAAIDKKPVKQDKVTTKVNNTSTDTFTDKIAVIGSPGLSSDPCAAIDKKLMKLYEFMIMVNNTSAFHLEEKAEALSVPGISVSNNKKKMLRDAEKKRVEIIEERQKYGCEPI